jgi:hypothetical protein
LVKWREVKEWAHTKMAESAGRLASCIAWMPEEPPEGKRIVYLEAGIAGTPAVFPATVKRLNVKLQADAPERLMHWVDVGVSVAGVRGDDRRRFYRDRMFVARLSEAGKDGLTVMETVVEDLETQLDLGGQVAERTFVEAQLTVEGSQGDNTRQLITIDRFKPQLQELKIISQTGDAVPEGADSTLEVRVDDDSGIDRIELGYDKNGNRAADDDEWLPLQRLGAKTAAGKIQLKLPTRDLPVGVHTLLVRAVDKVGYVSDWHNVTVTITPSEHGSVNQ